MSDHEPGPHASDDPSHDVHDAHAEVAFGPIDWQAWAMALLGGALGVLISISLVIAAHP